MTLTTSQAMAQFLEDISITDYQKTSIVQARKDRVVENLTNAFPATSDLPFASAILMGSAAKGTIVRPIDDIDVLAVFSNVKSAWSKYGHDSKSFLYRIRRAYDGLSVAEVGARGQAIRIFFQNGGHVDVAPVSFYGNNVYGLPSGTGTWISTAPTVANNMFATRNAALGYNLSPLVRLLKKWNQAHSMRLKSFHLETMAGSAFSSLSSNRVTGLQKFFEWGSAHLDVSDPGGQSGSLSGYLTWAARQDVIRSFEVASSRALKALEAESRGDHVESTRLWGLVLGPNFPQV